VNPCGKGSNCKQLDDHDGRRQFTRGGKEEDCSLKKENEINGPKTSRGASQSGEQKGAGEAYGPENEVRPRGTSG